MKLSNLVFRSIVIYIVSEVSYNKPQPDEQRNNAVSFLVDGNPSEVSGFRGLSSGLMFRAPSKAVTLATPMSRVAVHSSAHICSTCCEETLHAGWCTGAVP